MLHALLVGDAEAVLLVHDQQAEVLELHVLAEQPVRADDDVDGAVLQPLDDLLLLLRRAEAREQLDLGRERREALGKRRPVLLGQHRRRHQHRDLHAVGHRLERRTQRDFRLAVADVAGHEPVHRPRALHVAFDVLDRAQLVRRLLEAERRLELPLPRRVRLIGVALGHRAPRVELQQLLGHLAQRRTDRFLDALPRRAAEAVQARGARVGAEVLRDEVEAVDGDVELVVVGVLEQQEVGVLVADAHRAQPEILPDAVIFVDDEVADGEIGERGQGGAALVLGPPQRAPARAEDLRLGQDHQSHRGHREAARQLAHHDGDRVRRLQPLDHARVEIMVVEDLAQVLGLARIGGDEADGEALAAPAVDVVDEPVELARVRIHGERLERDVGLPGGEDFQLDARTAGDDLDQRPAARRVFGGLVEQPRRVHDDGRAGGQILEEARGARVSRLRHRDQRQHEQLVERPRRALRRRIEEADRLDVVAVELQPRRARMHGREDVDDAAAGAPLPDLDDGVGALVAGLLERLQQQLAVEAVLRREAQRALAERARRLQRRVQRRRRHHDRDRLARRQPPHDHRALGFRLAMVAALPELRLALRELERGGAEELEVLREAVGVGERRDDDDDGPRMGVQKLGDGERARRAGEPGHAEADVSLGEPLCQVPKRLPVPQHLDGLRYHGEGGRQP